MTAQKQNLMEELANRDFIYTDEDHEAIVYEKTTREGSEIVTIFQKRDVALHERYNKSGLQVSSFRYDTENRAEMFQLLKLVG